MYLTRADWDVITGCERLFLDLVNLKIKKDEFFSKLDGLIYAARTSTSHETIRTLSDPEKEILLRSLSLFCSLTFEKYDVSEIQYDSIQTNQYQSFSFKKWLEKMPEQNRLKLESLIGNDRFYEEESAAEGEFLTIQNNSKHDRSKVSLNAINFKARLGKNYLLLKKIYSNAFELSFFSQKAPLVFYVDFGLSDLFERLLFDTLMTLEDDIDLLEGEDYYFKNKRWNYEFIQTVISNVISDFDDHSTYIELKANSSLLYKKILDELPHSETDYKMSVLTVNEPHKVVKHTDYSKILEILKNHSMFLICFSSVYSYFPYIFDKIKVRPLLPKDIRPIRGDSSPLIFLSQLAINLNSNNTVVSRTDIENRITSGKLSDSLSSAVSRIQSKDSILKGTMTIDSVRSASGKINTKTGKIDSYELIYCNIPIIFIE